MLGSDKNRKIRSIRQDLSIKLDIPISEIVLIHNNRILEDHYRNSYYNISSIDEIWSGRLCNFMNEFGEHIVLELRSNNTRNSIGMNEKIIIRSDQKIGEARSIFARSANWVARIKLWNYKKEELMDDQIIAQCGLIDIPIIFIDCPELIAVDKTQLSIAEALQRLENLPSNNDVIVDSFSPFQQNMFNQTYPILNFIRIFLRFDGLTKFISSQGTNMNNKLWRSINNVNNFYTQMVEYNERAANNKLTIADNTCIFRVDYSGHLEEASPDAQLISFRECLRLFEEIKEKFKGILNKFNSEKCLSSISMAKMFISMFDINFNDIADSIENIGGYFNNKCFDSRIIYKWLELSDDLEIIIEEPLCKTYYNLKNLDNSVQNEQTIEKGGLIDQLIINGIQAGVPVFNNELIKPTFEIPQTNMDINLVQSSIPELTNELIKISYDSISQSNTMDISFENFKELVFNTMEQIAETPEENNVSIYSDEDSADKILNNLMNQINEFQLKIDDITSALEDSRDEQGSSIHEEMKESLSDCQTFSNNNEDSVENSTIDKYKDLNLSSPNLNDNINRTINILHKMKDYVINKINEIRSENIDLIENQTKENHEEINPLSINSEENIDINEDLSQIITNNIMKEQSSTLTNNYAILDINQDNVQKIVKDSVNKSILNHPLFNSYKINTDFLNYQIIETMKKNQDSSLMNTSEFLTSLGRATTMSLISSNDTSLADANSSLQKIMKDYGFANVFVDPSINESAPKQMFSNHPMKSSEIKELLANDVTGKSIHLTTNSFDHIYNDDDVIKSGENISSITMSRLDNFEKLDLLGKGGYGTVRTYKNKLTGQICVIKKIKNCEKIKLEQLKEMWREIIASYRLTSHSRIIRYFNYYEKDDSFYIEMEHMKGGSFRNYLDKNKKLPDCEIKHFSYQILDGLQYLHDKLMWHGDIKPDNILLDEDKNVKLSDFGLANHIKDEKDNQPIEINQSCMGTSRYMAPEMSTIGRYEAPIDIWAFGVIVYEMATGQLPFPKMSDTAARIKIAQIGNIGNINSLIPSNKSWLKSIINNCIKKDPKDRMTSSELLNLLSTF